MKVGQQVIITDRISWYAGRTGVIVEQGSYECMFVVEIANGSRISFHVNDLAAV